MSTTDPKLPAPERTTISVHSLITPSSSEAFAVWAVRRGLSTSAAVRALMNYALWREASGDPIGALPGTLPPAEARRIVTGSEAPTAAPEA